MHATRQTGEHAAEKRTAKETRQNAVSIPPPSLWEETDTSPPQGQAAEVFRTPFGTEILLKKNTEKNTLSSKELAGKTLSAGRDKPMKAPRESKAPRKSSTQPALVDDSASSPRHDERVSGEQVAGSPLFVSEESYEESQEKSHADTVAGNLAGDRDDTDRDAPDRDDIGYDPIGYDPIEYDPIGYDDIEYDDIEYDNLSPVGPDTVAAPRASAVVSSERIPDPLHELDTAIRHSRQIRDVSDYQMKLQLAESFLNEAKSILGNDPARSLVLTVDAIKRYRQLGQSIPPAVPWVLGQALATQCWGESLADALPAVDCMAVTEDGCWLLTGCVDGTVRLWDVGRYHDRHPSYILDDDGARFVKLLFTPDMRWAIGGTQGGMIRLWNTTQNNPSQCRLDIPGRIPGLRGMEISPDGRWLVAYGGGSAGLPEHSRHPLSPPESHAGDDASSLDPNVVWVWDMARLLAGDHQPIPLRGHEKPINTVVISKDSRWLISGSEDRTARIYDLRSQTLGLGQTVLKGHREEVVAAAIAPDNRWIATGGRDNIVHLWKMPEQGNVPVSIPLPGHLGWISSLAASPDGNWLASAGYDKTVRLWDMRIDYEQHAISPEPVVLQTRQGALHKVCFSPDGKVLVSQGVDSSLRLWEVDADEKTADGSAVPRIGEIPIVLRDQAVSISDFVLTGDNRWLILAYRHGTEDANNGVRLWPLQFEIAFAFAADYVQACFAPNAPGALQSQFHDAKERSVWR